MTLDLGRLVSRSFAIAWHHRWLWVLGVFGGVGAGNLNTGNPRGGGQSAAQVSRFLNEHLAIVLALVTAIVVIALVAFVVSCVAVPASIWASLELDAGREVGLRSAWREGRLRFWRYLRLALLKGLAVAFVLAVAGVLVAAGTGIYAAGGAATIAPLVLLGGILLVVFVLGLIVLALGLTWSERLLVILGLDAVDSLRAGWWLFRHSKLDTVIVAVVFYVLRLVLTIAITIVALLAALPGIICVIVYFAGHAGSLTLLVAGIAWIAVLGGGVEIVGAGFLGALYQAGYAMAARDLSVSRGLQPAAT